MLTHADNERLQEIKCLYLEWCDTGDHSKVTACADVLTQCDDPQAVWEKNVEWGEKLTGIPCPDECRDITKTTRIKQALKNRSVH